MRAVPGRLEAWLRRVTAPETRAFARDSAKLGVGSAATVAGYAAQIALITHFLGLSAYGVFALVVSTVDLIARLFDFQVGQMTVAYVADARRSAPERIPGIAQFSLLVDAAAGIAGFAVVAAVAPLAAEHLLGSNDDWALFVLYGLTLLVTTTETTSVALLQSAGRFGLIARVTIGRELTRIVAILVALLLSDSLYAIVIVLVAFELAFATIWTIGAARTLGPGALLRPALRSTAGIRRDMARMVFHTNLVSYVKVLAAQAPTLLLGAMRTPAEVGVFKVATAIAAVVGKPADPAWAAILPRLARLGAEGKRAEIIALVRQATAGALLGMLAVGALAVVFREPLLRLVGGAEAAATGGVVLTVAVAARIVNGALFWNSPLLYALRQARAAATVFVAGSLVFAPALVMLIDTYGAEGAAWALLLWSVLVNAGLTLVALRRLGQVGLDPLRTDGAATPTPLSG